MKKKEIKRSDIPPEVYQQLENEFYQSFDFMKLYQTAPEAGLERFIPYVTLGLIIINLFLLWKK